MNARLSPIRRKARGTRRDSDVQAQACFLDTYGLPAAVAMPAMGEGAPSFDTWMKRQITCATARRTGRGRFAFTLSVQEALTMPEDDLRQEFLQMAPLMSRLYASFDHGGNGVEVVITPVYRAGVRMLDAWRTDDESALSQQERSALDEAEAIVERLQARYSSSLELERAIFDELCARLAFNEMLEKEPSEDALGVSAAFALTHGWATARAIPTLSTCWRAWRDLRWDSKMDTTPGFCMRGTRWN